MTKLRRLIASTYKKRFIGLFVKWRGREASNGSQVVASGAGCPAGIQSESTQASTKMSSPVRDWVGDRIPSPSFGPNSRRLAVVARGSPGDSLRRPDVTDNGSGELQSSIAYVNENILQTLPNDLTKLIYLASIRDYNTGTYLHPTLSRLYDVKFADQVLRFCHEEVFGRIVVTSIRQCVAQMQRYIQFTGAGQTEVIATWKSLQAYKSTVPTTADPLSVEVFSLNIDAALLVLEEALRRPSLENPTTDTE